MDSSSDASDGAVTPSKFTIGGNVSGLVGAGLVLQNNGGDDLSVNGDGPFTFATSLTDGTNYAVSVSVQPTGQLCAVTNGSGKLAGAKVTNVAVACKTLYTVGGTVTGLVGTGLVLTNNGGDDITLDAGGPFTFATKVVDGGAYTVAVKTSPTGPAQTCAVVDGNGNVPGADVTSVIIKCASKVCTTPNENQSGDITCPAGTTVKSIDFASYGTPTGACEAFVASACDAATSMAVVEAACLGNATCSLSATNGVFGDPCVGTFKRLYAQATCE